MIQLLEVLKIFISFRRFNPTFPIAGRNVLFSKTGSGKHLTPS